MTISAPPTSPNNVEDQSPVSKPNFNIVQGGRGARQECFPNDVNGTPFEQSVPRIMAIVVGSNHLHVSRLDI